MKTVSEILRDADPLVHEPHRLEAERDRLRQAILAAVSGGSIPSSARLPSRAARLAIVALIIAIVAGSLIWSQRSAPLHAAAIQFELRLAEDDPAPGLRELWIAGSNRSVYVHEENIVTNDDIADSSVIRGNGSSSFGVTVEFTPAGAQKMLQATKDHVGKHIAILIDGDVVAAPIVKDPISTSAVIDGIYTETEAQTLADGIRVR